jgi:diguanylate cyclase (GGDEF)-like protein/PAS domain S-box-containing protein
MTKVILDKSRTPFYRLSPAGRVDYANQAACQSLGYSEVEMVGLYPWDFDPDFKPEYWPDVWDRLKRHEIVHINTRHKRKDGTFIDVEVTGHYISNGTEEFSFTFVQDITERKAAEEMIRQKESYLRALIDNFPFMVWLKDKEGRFLASNQIHAHSHGFSTPDDIAGKTDFDLSPSDLANHYRENDLSIMQSGQKQVIEEQYEGPVGRQWIETYKAPVIGHNGEMLGTVGFSRDITERKVVETELRMTASIFNSQVGMVVTDNECVILKVNEGFTKVTGYKPEEAIGKHMSFLSSGVHQPTFYKSMWEKIILNDGWQGEIWNHRSDGEIYPQWLTITAIKGVNDHVTNYVGTMMDISDRKVIEEKMQHLAHYDALTNLPNRVLLMDRLQFGIAQARRNKSLFCLMYLDLDRFKEVNDTLGHSIGDLLLKEVSQRLLKNIKRETDTVARMGGDEFIILLSKIQNHDDVIQIAKSILNELDSTFNLMDNQVHISASIGIAFYPTHAEDAEALIKVADAALYEAKRNGKNCYKFASF